MGGLWWEQVRVQELGLCWSRATGLISAHARSVLPAWESCCLSMCLQPPARQPLAHLPRFCGGEASHVLTRRATSGHSSLRGTDCVRAVETKLRF